MTEAQLKCCRMPLLFKTNNPIIIINITTIATITYINNITFNTKMYTNITNTIIATIIFIISFTTVTIMSENPRPWLWNTMHIIVKLNVLPQLSLDLKTKTRHFFRRGSISRRDNLKWPVIPCQGDQEDQVKPGSWGSITCLQGQGGSLWLQPWCLERTWLAPVRWWPVPELPAHQHQRRHLQAGQAGQKAPPAAPSQVLSQPEWWDQDPEGESAQRRRRQATCSGGLDQSGEHEAPEAAPPSRPLPARGGDEAPETGAEGAAAEVAWWRRCKTVENKVKV